MSGVSEAVVEALSRTDIVEASTGIKNAVCAELGRTDKSATIKRTEYFNHSYVPDVVIEWPDGHEREVFLRFASYERLAADVERVGGSGPILFDLTVDSDRSDLVEGLSREVLVRAPDALLTDAEATEHIRPDKAENMLERLVTSNVLRAGHGLLDEVTSERTIIGVRSGFEAAMSGDRGVVHDALELARPIFGLEMERRVERTLQLLWWVGGADEQEFPISIPDDMELDSRDTREFLKVVLTDKKAVGDEEFWPRLADRLDFETLASVGSIRDSANLNSLMTAFSNRAELSHAAVDLRDRPMPPFDAYSWAIEDGFVILTGPDWICRMTPMGNRFSQRREQGAAVSLDEASLRSYDYRVEEAEFDEVRRQVSLSRKSLDPAAPSPRTLQDLAKGFEPSAQVRRLTVLAGMSRLTADFERMLVGADPDVRLRSLAQAAPVLLAGVDGGDLVALRQFLDG